MALPIESVTGRIVEYDERTSEIVIRAKYSDLSTMLRREFKECTVTLIDSRPLSDKQRRACYAMLREIADWAGYDTEEMKDLMKIRFWCEELWQTADSLFSLSDAPMSVVAAFQRWLARFIVSNDIPTRFPMLEYVDDINDYVYSCLIHKRCCICGKPADLHHVDRIGMGRNRDEIVHEGMEVLPLCRIHHNETHTIPDTEFFAKYHLDGGIECDKTICKIYGLKKKGTKTNAEQN